MRILYDRQTDTAYIQLSDNTRKARTHACDPIDVNGEINLDFDREGELIGIEVQDAKRLLTPDLLATARRRRISQRIAPPSVPPMM